MALHLLRCFALTTVIARARVVVGVVLSHARQGLLLFASLLLTMQGVSAAAMPDCHQGGNSTADSTASGLASLPGGDSCGCDCLHALALPVAGLPALRPVPIGFVVVMPSLGEPAVNLSRELRPPISA